MVSLIDAVSATLPHSILLAISAETSPQSMHAFPSKKDGQAPMVTCGQRSKGIILKKMSQPSPEDHPSTPGTSSVQSNHSSSGHDHRSRKAACDCLLQEGGDLFTAHYKRLSRSGFCTWKKCVVINLSLFPSQHLPLLPACTRGN